MPPATGDKPLAAISAPTGICDKKLITGRRTRLRDCSHNGEQSFFPAQTRQHTRRAVTSSSFVSASTARAIAGAARSVAPPPARRNPGPSGHPRLAGTPVSGHAPPPTRTEPLPARVLLAFRLDVNEWKGERKVQFLVEGAQL